jgi:CubicO group peptidase (beta-lactamase class C family)
MGPSSVRSLFAALLLAIAVAAGARAQTVFPGTDWQVDKPEAQSMSGPVLEKVGAWLKESGSKAGLVVRHGRIVGEWYFDDATAESRYLVYSSTKSFASTAAGLAIAAGKLSLDTKVGEVLPDVRPEGKREVTVRQLLSMTSGVHNEGKFGSLPDMFDYALHEAPMDHRPGEKWDYNNTGLAILSPLVKQADGRYIDQILDEQVFRPIGIQAADWEWQRQGEIPLSFSGLHITARAFARFGLMFMNGGKWQTEQIVPAAWVAEAGKPSQTMNPSYGYLWWNNTTDKWPGVPKDAYASLGAFDNDMLLVPSLDLIVIRQVGDDSANKRKLKIGELFKLAVDAVDDKAAKE